MSVFYVLSFYLTGALATFTWASIASGKRLSTEVLVIGSVAWPVTLVLVLLGRGRR